MKRESSSSLQNLQWAGPTFIFIFIQLKSASLPELRWPRRVGESVCFPSGWLEDDNVWRTNRLFRSLRGNHGDIRLNKVTQHQRFIYFSNFITNHPDSLLLVLLWPVRAAVLRPEKHKIQTWCSVLLAQQTRKHETLSFMCLQPKH